MEATSMLSEKGKPLLVFKNYKFSKTYMSKRGKILWRCVNKQCLAKLYTLSANETLILEGHFEHTHREEHNINRQACSNFLKRKATENIEEKPSKLIHQEMKINAYAKGLCCEDLYRLRRNIYHERRSKSKLLNNMVKRQLLLLSSSRLHGHEFLEYAEHDICELLTENDASTVLFVPYALKDHDGYLKTVEKPFKKWGYQVKGIHTDDPIEAVKQAQAIFIGGGNTFRLLKTLYDLNLIDIIRKRVLEDGIPYIGASAGTNVATRSINTTNDMPIVYPPTFEALKLVPFNINPHYQDADLNSTHKGETRQQRINEYLEEEDSRTVLGLREGATLYVKNKLAVLKGVKGGIIFAKGKEPKEIEPGSDLSYLLQE